MTTATAEKLAFLDRRRVGMGGSDLGAVLGLNPYRTPFEVWQEKTGRVVPSVNNLQVRFGSHAEAFVAQEYTRATGRHVQRYNTMLRHPDAPLIGHVDRLVVPDGKKLASHAGVIRTDRLLECKTAHAFAASRSDVWGPSGSDQVPESYLIQCAAYLAMTGCQYADLAVLFGNSDFRVYTIARDADLEALILREASQWWERHVVADVPPEPGTEAEARQRWASHRPGATVTLSPDQTAALRDLARLKAQIKEMDRIEAGLKDRLIPYFADAERILGPDGRELATYRASKASQRIDWHGVVDALKTDLDLSESDWDTLINTHTEIKPGARTLRLKSTLEDET